MNVLICNDDGINSIGIKALSNEFSREHNVLVVAPDGNRSACAHSLSINKKVILRKIDEEQYRAYSISGTPADCVKIARLIFPDFKPDVVIAGINNGYNLGTDVLYSGTVSIACEASFFGHTSFAFSAKNLSENILKIYCKYASKIVKIFTDGFLKGEIYNVNFPFVPAEEIKGIKITSLGKQIYTDRYIFDEDGYKLVGELVDHSENVKDCDIEWIKKGYITITPILFDKTDYKNINKVKKKCKKLL